MGTVQRIRMMRAARSPRSESGDTLIEVLFALVIIALSVSALLGALITAVATSGEHRSLSVEDTLLRSYVETAEYQIQVQSTPAPLFAQCAPTYPITFSMPPGSSGYSVSITGVQYWNGSGFDSSCGSNDKKGVQLVTVSSTGPGATQTLSFVVRDPSDTPSEGA
jgi:type II secretory pathway pseudopilin PulG